MGSSWRLGSSLALAVSCFLLISALVGESRIQGDGAEYLLTTQSLATHLSPDVRHADVDALVDTLGAHDDAQPASRQALYEELQAAMAQQRPRHGGWWRARSGAYYSWHFWLYSLLCLPAWFICELASLHPLKAFALTHWLVVSATLLYVMRAWRATELERCSVAVVYLLGGTTFYFLWSHPEVFTASCLLVALLMMLDRRWLPAALLASLASTQNPPVALVVLLALAFFVLERGRRGGDGWHFASLLRSVSPSDTALVAGSIAIGASPALFYGSVLGRPNPILGSSAVDPANIGASRLFSLFFDLNQGMVVGQPGTLLVLAALAVAYLPRALAKSAPSRQVGGVVVGLLSLSVAMALPVLMLQNWNQGMSVYGRHAFWLSMPVGLALVLLLRAAQPRWRSLALVTLVASQGAAIAAFGVWGEGAGGFYHMKGGALWVARHAPDLYNPQPEIFAERLSSVVGRTQHLDKRRLYRVVRPDVLAISKVLFHQSNAAALRNLCGSAGEALPTERQPQVVPAEHGWRYQNGAVLCAWNGRALSLASDNRHSDGLVDLAKGWGRRHRRGVPTTAGRAELRVPRLVLGGTVPRVLTMKLVDGTPSVGMVEAFVDERAVAAAPIAETIRLSLPDELPKHAELVVRLRCAPPGADGAGTDGAPGCRLDLTLQEIASSGVAAELLEVPQPGPG